MNYEQFQGFWQYMESGFESPAVNRTIEEQIEAAVRYLEARYSHTSCHFWNGFDCQYEPLFLGCSPCRTCPPFDEREDLVHPFVD